MIYFISDTHFGHKNILRIDNRPYSSIEEMNNALIYNWNSRVHPDDDVYHLGDICCHGTPVEYLKRLNGRIHLVIGNHDLPYVDKPDIIDNVVSVKQMDYLQYNNKRIILCHYPLAEWNGFYRGALHIYGHVHGSVSPTTRMMLAHRDRAFNAGCMINNYMPVTLEELIVNNQYWYDRVACGEGLVRNG